MTLGMTDILRETLAPGEAYLAPLPQNISLCVYNGDALIFSDSGKWLMPLFVLENFLKEYAGSRDDLCAHDTAVGKAAAVLMIRMGIKKIYANLASALAENYIAEINKTRAADEQIAFSYGAKVERLLCATEDLLETMRESDDMYTLLRQRAKLVQGVAVNVSHLFAPYGFIKDLSFSLPAGGRLMIRGENGAGKTTLLKLIMGMVQPLSGEITIDGKAPRLLPKRTIGYIPQQTDDAQFSLSVEEVVSLGLARGVKNKNAAIQKALMRTGAAHLSERDFSSLSGGEKQKVSLARCLAQNARLLLLDEPTAALDAENRAMVVDILLSLSVSEIPTIIVVTHDDALFHMHGWETLTLSAQGEGD